MTDKMITPKKKSTKAKAKSPENVRIFFILDRSGSMSSISEETIGGFNAFLEEQKKLPGKATLSLIQFDHEFQITHDNLPINDVPPLDSSSFQPRGMTALYDAVGMTISKFKEDVLKNTKTIVAILTDGQENSSKEYNYPQVQELIKEVEGKKGWDVLFIGANMNAQAVAATMGIAASKSVTFDYSKKGAMDAINTLNYATTALRGVACGDTGQSISYADGEALTANSLDMTKLYSSVKSEGIKVDNA